MEISELTGSERRVWEAFPHGGRVDLAGEPEESRALRAEVLRGLLLGDNRRDDDVAALRVTGALITGKLDLRYAVAESAISLPACTFEEPLDLYGARLRQIDLSGCTLPALHAATVRVDGVLRITGCRIPGPVRLGGAQLSGAFFLDPAELGRPGRELGEPVLQPARHATASGGPKASPSVSVTTCGAPGSRAGCAYPANSTSPSPGSPTPAVRPSGSAAPSSVSCGCARRTGSTAS
ncbi:hypothetical protein [Streptomyces luteolus]|uniref:Uncharacterized protein n=1 Tax=Streptomyces luteolus TaxID=3043615 RepID=A0ABT6T5Z8_9ACTN|nr:hypothetical protein [Streptomyces sp. B-S-A12]MDI3423313.1 hypothetical protein [Streptomyces sp. B-S-A12]